jgi:hypothetical protein
VTLLLNSAQKTAAILTDVFSFRELAREGSVIRFAAAGPFSRTRRRDDRIHLSLRGTLQLPAPGQCNSTHSA